MDRDPHEGLLRQVSTSKRDLFLIELRSEQAYCGQQQSLGLSRKLRTSKQIQASSKHLVFFTVPFGWDVTGSLHSCGWDTLE